MDNKYITFKSKKYLLYDICYHILYNNIYTCYTIIHFDERYLYNIKYMWSILCNKYIRRASAIQIASLSFIDKKQITVIAITSKPGTRDPMMQYPGPGPGRSRPVPSDSGF